MVAPLLETSFQADRHLRHQAHVCPLGLLTRADAPFMFGSFATDFKVGRYNTLCIP